MFLAIRGGHDSDSRRSVHQRARKPHFFPYSAQSRPYSGGPTFKGRVGYGGPSFRSFLRRDRGMKRSAVDPRARLLAITLTLMLTLAAGRAAAIEADPIHFL